MLAVIEKFKPYYEVSPELRDFIKAKGLTKKAFAKMCQTSEPYMNDLLAGRRTCAAATGVRIQKVVDGLLRV